MTESLLAWVAHYGYIGLFAALMFGIAGLPIPDETILVFCGYLISQHRLDPAVTYLSGLAGSISGITLSYWIGHSGGTLAIERYGKYIHLTPQRVALVHAWFRRFGNWLLTFGYFILGVRHFTAFIAGASGLEFGIFARFAYLGAAIWVACFLLIGYLVGDHWRDALEWVHRYSVLLTIVVAAAVLIAVLWARHNRRRGP